MSIPQMIPQHLMHPQTLPQIHVPRERLVIHFNQYLFAKVMLIKGLFGYGKSVAVTEYTQHLTDPVAWYPLDQLDFQEPFTFTWNLVRAIQVNLPSFGQEIATHLERVVMRKQAYEAEKIITTILPSLIHEIAGLEHRLWIVLENYHVISHKGVDEIMMYLVERAPQQLTLIVTSQMVPRWSAKSQWEAQGRLITISADELAFTQTESRTLASEYGVHLQQAQIDKIYAAIGGWPILHVLLYQSCHGDNSEQIEDLLQILMRPDHEIYQYFAWKLLQQELPLVRDFLCRTALLRHLDSTICNELLGIRYAEQILVHLSKSAFLNTIIEEKRITYVHSHQIIREFLRQTLQQDYGAEEVNALNHRLAIMFENQQDWDQAIAYYCQAEQFAEAIDLILNRGAYLVNTAQLSRLAAWMDRIPRDLIDKNPTHLVYQGIILGNQESIRAENCFLQAITLFKEQGDAQGCVWATGELGWFYFLQDRLHRSVETLQKALQEPGIPSRLLAHLLHYLSMAYNGLDQFIKAVECIEQALHVLDQLNTIDDKVSSVRLLRHASHIYHYLGDTQKSLRALEKASSLARAFDLGDWSLAWIDNQLAEIHRHLGNFTTAHSYLDEADALLNKYRQSGSQSPLLKFVLITRGHLYREVYDYTKAEELYRKAGYGGASGTMLALRLVQPDYTQEALELARENWREEQRGESPVSRGAFQAMLGIAYLNASNYEQSQLYLEAAEKIFEKYNAIYFLITVRMYLSKLYLIVDEKPKGIQSLRYTLSQMAEEGYYGLDIWQPWVVAEMCAQAILEEIEPDFVERLIMRRLVSQHVDPFLPLVSNNRQAVRNRSSRILESLGCGDQILARQIISECLNKQTRQRLVQWLDEKWLTEVGLVRLKQLLTWRQIETFLLWIHPLIQGSIEKIAEEMGIGRDGVNTNLRNIRTAFQEKADVRVPGGKGAHSAAYHWAVREHFIDPYIDSSIGQSKKSHLNGIH